MSFAFVAQSCSGQVEKDIVILTLKDDRVELTKALSFLRSTNSKLICLNVSLSECKQDTVDGQLIKVFNEIDSLVVSSKIVPFGTSKFRDVRLLCSYFDSSGDKDGFVNLIFNDITNRVEKFQTKNIYKAKNFHTEEIKEIISYHMAVNIAFAINSEKTSKFINSNRDTVKIDFSKKREFETYSFDQFVEKKIDKKVLEGRVVIVTSLSSEYLLVPRYENNMREFRKMSTSEIFANIACQLVE